MKNMSKPGNQIMGRKSYRTPSNTMSGLNRRSLDSQNLSAESKHSNYEFNNSRDNSLRLNATDEFPSKCSETQINTSTPYREESVSFNGKLYPFDDLKNISNEEFEEYQPCRRNKSNENIKYKHEEVRKVQNNSGSKKNKSTNENNNSCMYIIPLVIIAVLATIFSSNWNNTAESVTKIDIRKLQEQFPSQPNETWEYFETVIDDILFINPSHPAVFLLLYTNEAVQVNDLVHHLANYASVKLNTNENYIFVDKREFHTKEAIRDYGYLIDKYEQDLIKKQVMVVHDLQEISGKVAQAFHTLCDEITPLVERVVYIFTLKVDSVQGKPENIAEKYLIKIWNDLDNDILMPLITRVTSTVLKITN